MPEKAEISQEYAPNSPSSAPEVLDQFGFYHPKPQYGHRSLSPTLSQDSTNVGSPHFGSTYVPEGKEVIEAYAPPAQTEDKKKKRICGLSAMVFWILLVLLILIIAGLAAGLGAGLSKKSKS